MPVFEVRLPSALESFVRESPIVAGAVALVVVVFVVVLVAGIVSGLRGRRRRAAIRREPRLYGVTDDRDDELPAYAEVSPVAAPVSPEPAPPRERRRGFGFAALTLAFILGLVAGMAAMLTSRHDIADGLSRLAALVAPDSTDTVRAAPATAPVLPPEAPPPAASVASNPAPGETAEDIAARLDAFATSLKASLPRQAGPDLSLEQVSVDGSTLNLAYSVGRVLPPEEVAPFQAYIERTVRSLFCAEAAREIRYLSQNGVVFHMTYADSAGSSLSELTVTPAYCG